MGSDTTTMGVVHRSHHDCKTLQQKARLIHSDRSVAAGRFFLFLRDLSAFKRMPQQQNNIQTNALPYGNYARTLPGKPSFGDRPPPDPDPDRNLVAFLCDVNRGM